MNTKTILMLAVLAGVAWLVFRSRRAPDAPLISQSQDARMQVGGGGGGGLDVFGMLGM